MNKIRVAMVDDHRLFREGLRDLLSAAGDIEIVGEGSDGSDALYLVSTERLDVLLLDLRLPNLGGVGALKRLRVHHPDIKAVVVSMYEDAEHRDEAIAAGAVAYHSKMDAAADILNTIRNVAAGQSPISDAERRRCEEAARGHPDTETLSLTDTEHRVLADLAKGYSNSELAKRLAMSERTVKNHLSAMFRKLGAKSRVDVVRRGVERRLISLQD